MTRKTVLLDCDGVLCDFIGGVCDTLARPGFPRVHEPHHVTSWDFRDSLKLDEATRRSVTSAIAAPGWWIRLSPFPDARAGVDALREGADVYIVTSPWNSCTTWLHERETWLKKHFDIPHSHVIATCAKHLVRGDILVDDKTETLHAWADRWYERDGEMFAVQWQTPHNLLDGWGGHSTRSWSQLLEWAR